jgi:hypothetical protein
MHPLIDKSRIPPRLHEHFDRALENLDRVENLVALYRASCGGGRSPRTVQRADLLRSSVVFLHAALEDFLREIARERLPQASSEALDNIPLLGTSPTGRAEKFLLGRLAQYRGMTVDELIAQSVAAAFERSNFNDASEVVRLLTSCGVNTKRIARYLPDVQNLIKRRHQIVHRADRRETDGMGARPSVEPIHVATVERWATAVSNTVKTVLMDLYVPGARFHGEGQAN